MHVSRGSSRAAARLTLLALSATAIFGCDSLSDVAATRDHLIIGTYNAGLADGFVDFARQRAEPVAQALAESDFDVLCLQEVWLAQDWERINAVGLERWRAATRRPNEGGEAGQCTAEETMPLEMCARENCSDVPVEMLAGCALQNCAEAFAILAMPCAQCVVAQVGQTIEAILDVCGPAAGEGAGAYTYEGSFGTGIVSTMPVRQTDSLLLRSTTVRRTVLYSLLAGTAVGDVHFFCTHLTAALSSVPYTGQFASWEEEQAAQIDDMLAFVQSKAGDDGQVVLLGDMNTGPEAPGISAEFPAHYQKFVDAGFANPYLEAGDVQCTFCEENLLIEDFAGGDGGLIDHIFTRNVPGTFQTSRVLDQPIEIEVDGAARQVSYSDHFGVRMRIER